MVLWAPCASIVGYLDAYEEACEQEREVLRAPLSGCTRIPWGYVLRLVPMQAIVRAIAPSRRRERGWRRARATRRALLPPPVDRQARAGRRIGDASSRARARGDSEVAASDWSTCAIA
jgi:hypothetical protein